MQTPAIDPVTEGVRFVAFLHRDSLCCRRLMKQIEQIQEMISLPWDLLFVDEEEPRQLAERIGIEVVPLVFITRKGRMLGHMAGIIPGDLERWIDWAVTSMVEDADKHA